MMISVIMKTNDVNIRYCYTFPFKRHFLTKQSSLLTTRIRSYSSNQQYIYLLLPTLSYDGCWSSLYIICIAYYFKRQPSYQDFLDRGLLLTRKLLNQMFLLVKLKSSLRKFYGPHHDLVNRYGISVSQMTTDMFHLS